ncbi:hypothetical protein SAMN02910358_00830 [Lachnospiraceae bacterium XBB1006]|nr:hypothetical protein SAMN02910358_00830 [Lachnospiraceae bacterium XBB1006]
MDFTNEPMNNPVVPEQPVKKKIPMWIIPVVIVVIAAVVAAALYFTGFFMSRNDKILKAMANTFKPDHSWEKIFNPEIYQSGVYTVDFDGKLSSEEATGITNESDVKVKMALDRPKKQSYLSAEIGIAGQSYSGTVLMDDKEIRIASPTIIDQDVLVYNYTEAVTGYLKQIGDKYGITFDDLNEALKNSFETSNKGTTYLEEMKKVTRQKFDELKFEDTSDSTYTVDGKEVKCIGYQATLTKEWTKALMDEYEKLTKEYIESFENLQLKGKSADDIFKDSDKFSEKVDGSLLSFYLYEDRVAAIGIDAQSGNNLEIRIEGGATPLENVTIHSVNKEKGNSDFVRKGSTKGTVEERTYLNNGEEILKTSYDCKNGNLKITAKGLTVDGTVKVSPKAEIESITATGQEYKLNDMDAMQFQTLVYKIMSKFASSAYGGYGSYGYGNR